MSFPAFPTALIESDRRIVCAFRKILLYDFFRFVRYGEKVEIVRWFLHVQFRSYASKWRFTFVFDWILLRCRSVIECDVNNGYFRHETELNVSFRICKCCF